MGRKFRGDMAQRRADKHRERERALAEARDEVAEGDGGVEDPGVARSRGAVSGVAAGGEAGPPGMRRGMKNAPDR